MAGVTEILKEVISADLPSPFVTYEYEFHSYLAYSFVTYEFENVTQMPSIDVKNGTPIGILIIRYFLKSRSVNLWIFSG